MKKVAAFLLALIFIFSAESNAFAAEVKLEPENFFIQATAGQRIREAVLIKNLSLATKSLQLVWQGYNLPEGEFTNQTDLEKHSINFAAISQTGLELQPLAATPVEIEFKIPKVIEPADYYGSLLVQEQGSEQKVDFTLRILGIINESIDTSRIIYSNSTLIFNIANNGSQTSSLTVKATIKGLFGQKLSSSPVKQQLKAAQNKNLSIETGRLLPGYYQAKISLEYGSQKNKDVFYSFWVHPEFFLIGGFLIFVIVALLAHRSKRRVRK